MRISPGGRRGFAWKPLGLGLGLVALTCYVLFRPPEADPHFGKPVGRPAPALALTDHRGEPFALEELRGKFVLVTFGFTHCPNICPTLLGNLAAAVRPLSPAERERVQVVFVTLDPERDTMAKLADYIPFFDPTFIGLTGTGAQIAATAKDWGVFHEKEFLPGDDAANNYTLNHTSYTYLIDPDGTWSLLYDYDQVAQPAEVTGDLRRVLKETGGA